MKVSPGYAKTQMKFESVFICMFFVINDFVVTIMIHCYNLSVSLY